MKKYHIETYGCEMNKAESAAIETALREHGWEKSAEDEANLIVLNTCTVRATAENRAWNRIHQLVARKNEHDFKLAVVGCMAEQHKSAIQRQAPGVDYVLGTFQKQSFGLMLDVIAAGQKIDIAEETPTYVFSADHHEQGAFRSYVPITHGCNNFCAYCIVPYVRGRETSRDPEDIIREIERMEDIGVREITLLGQNVNSYRWERADESLDFPGLLRLISSRVRERRGEVETSSNPRMQEQRIGWLRFLTSHPKDLSPALIEVLASDPIFCRHVHLPVQSGSNRILAAMNRKYTREEYLTLVESLRYSMPDITLSTDILVGFPGETEEDLEDTLDLMRRVKFSYAFMYHFNAREGTPAATMNNRVPDKVKKQRLARVIALQKEITSMLMKERIGAIDEVLIEDVSKRSSKEVLARTARDEMVVFPAPRTRIGQFARVRIVAISGNTFRGEEAC